MPMKPRMIIGTFFFFWYFTPSFLQRSSTLCNALRKSLWECQAQLVDIALRYFVPSVDYILLPQVALRRWPIGRHQSTESRSCGLSWCYSFFLTSSLWSERFANEAPVCVPSGDDWQLRVSTLKTSFGDDPDPVVPNYRPTAPQLSSPRSRNCNCKGAVTKFH